jgi:hypothetical protein
MNNHFAELGDVWKHLPLAEILRINPPRHYWETYAGSPSYAPQLASQHELSRQTAYRPSTARRSVLESTRETCLSILILLIRMSASQAKLKRQSSLQHGWCGLAVGSSIGTDMTPSSGVVGRTTRFQDSRQASTYGVETRSCRLASFTLQ